MASSSSTRTWKYDVFPSFSGEDVRKSFLSHLLEKLRSKSIISFIDNGIERSHLIELELLLAIRQSRISIVVLSKKYASSTWCLNELAEIHECHEESEQMVIPVFYEVDPSHVRKQTGEFGKAFEETCKGKTKDHIERWKKALAKVAGIAGYDSQKWSGEAEAIELISKDVLNKLLSTPSDDFRDFVGIGAHVEAIMDSNLCLESGGVRMVGILGPSGIGKSTIARALFSRLSSQFDHRAFVTYKRTMQDKKIADFGMKLSWARQFLSEILGQKDINIESLGVVEQRLKHRKVLIVLDDVDETELLETLVGRTGWFGFGSRIIVVTQDRALLKSHEIDLIHEVEFPSEDLALQMFCQSAFGKTSPPDGFMELAAEVAKLAGYLPLGLNVLGSSLRKKDKEYWVEMMLRLRNGLNGKIEKTLRVCYDGIDEKDDQDIFLYIAFLFNGESVNYIKNLLENGFYTSVSISLRTLADKSLVRITAPHETVQMHNLLQKLGKEIVRAESIYNPGKRRFLVDAKDICDVFNDNIGTENVIGIRLDISEIDEPLSMDKNSFKGMHNLQFLKFYKERWEQKTGEIRLNLPQGLVYLPRKLRLLHWDEYPAKHIPSSFSAEYLVELRMEYSKLEKLWEGTPPLRSLKKMDLRYSSDLKEIPDLSKATNLDILNLCNCTSLVTLPSSIRNLKKLSNLQMGGCSNLEVLPTDVNLESLDYLDLSDCSRLRSFPRISRNISILVLDGTAMEEEDCLWIENLSGLPVLRWENCPLRCMPSNLHLQEHLTSLRMSGSKLEKLWEGVESLENLEYLNLSGCKNLKEIPDLSKATNLMTLDLSGCENLKEIPDLSKATNLEHLYLSGCKNLKEIPDLSKATNLMTLDLSGCENLKEIPDLSKATNLEHLYLSGCKNLKEIPDLSKATNLEYLYLSGCKNLKEIPDLSKATNLMELDLSGCENLKEIPDLSKNINCLELNNCTTLVMLPSSIQHLDKLSTLNMRGCTSLEALPTNINLVSLTFLDLSGCSRLTSFPQLSTSIEELNLSDTAIEEVPSWIENMVGLTELCMSGCTSLEVLPTNINLVSLTFLYLDRCSRLTSFPQLSTSIEDLYLSETAIEEVPSWIENIAGLTRLCMRGCEKLKKISATIWNLKHLKHVDFTDCGGITSVSDASLVKTVAGLHAESIENHPMDMYPSWPFSNTEFMFCDCLNLDRDAQKFILQSDSRFAVLPGKAVPTYFTHRTRGSSLTVPLPQSSLSLNHVRFTACIDFAAKVDVHWKFRGATGMCNIDLGTCLYKLDHLLVFHFDFCPQEEVHGPPSHMDCNNVEFEFKLRNTGFLSIPIFHGKIKGCGVRVLNVSPSQDANDRSSESRESDVESGRSTKRMRMTVETSEENPNSLYGQTAVNSGSMAPNLELSLGLVGATAQVASRSKVPSPSISSRNFHGDEASLNLSLSPFDPCLEGKSLYFDPMITEQQDTWTSSEDTSLSPQLTNYFI